MNEQLGPSPYTSCPYMSPSARDLSSDVTRAAGPAVDRKVALSWKLKPLLEGLHMGLSRSIGEAPQ